MKRKFRFKDGKRQVQVFTASIRLKSGAVLYARDYGLKAFVFWVDAD